MRLRSACAAALALVTCVDADITAFTAVRDAAVAGSVAATRGAAGARGGLAPKMVAMGGASSGPEQDYLSSLEASRVTQPRVRAKDGAAWQNDAAEGPARFYNLERINKARTFLEACSTGAVDPTLLAKNFVFEGSDPDGLLTTDDFHGGRVLVGATEFHDFSLDAFNPKRIWFHARMTPSQVSQSQAGN